MQHKFHLYLILKLFLVDTTEDERTDINLDPRKAELLESIKLVQKLDLYKFCHSISGVKHDATSGKLVLKFHPMFEGEMHGPYQVRNKWDL